VVIKKVLGKLDKSRGLFALAMIVFTKSTSSKDAAFDQMNQAAAVRASSKAMRRSLATLHITS
jgi:hypothetical protein